MSPDQIVAIEQQKYISGHKSAQNKPKNVKNNLKVALSALEVDPISVTLLIKYFILINRYVSCSRAIYGPECLTGSAIVTSRWGSGISSGAR